MALVDGGAIDKRRRPVHNRRVFPRLLTLLQFTRIALVFTAVGDGWAAMLLSRRATGRPIDWAYALLITATSVLLYTFGMALNDLIDRRRDSQLAPSRPLPSGRISVRAARLLCVGLGAAHAPKPRPDSSCQPMPLPRPASRSGAGEVPETAGP